MTEAGVYICMACRENPGESCNDYCEMEQLRKLLVGSALPASASQERIDPYRLCIAIQELQRIIHLNKSLDPRPYIVHRIRRCPLSG